MTTACITACARSGRIASISQRASTPSLEVHKVVAGVWRHVSYQHLKKWGWFPSNGLIVETSAGPLLVDTAWTTEQTRELLRWVQRRWKRLPIGVVVTHAHDDRLGGLQVTGRAGIATYMTKAVADQAHKQNKSVPRLHVISTPVAQVRDVEVFYPGGGHTANNVVVWVPRARVIFGGCLVKSAASRGLGNIADATLETWSASISKVARRYPTARYVVPGHGSPADLALLDHTRALLTSWCSRHRSRCGH